MSRNWTFHRGAVACALAAVLVGACAGALAAAAVELSVVERQGVPRRGEPVTFAVPFPKGELGSAEHVRLVRSGKEVPAQFRVTGLWRPEKSIRWLLVDFQTDIEGGARQRYTLEYGEGVSAQAKPATAIAIQESDDAYTVSTGAARFRIGRKAFDLFQEVQLADGTVVVSRPDAAQPRFGAVVRGLKPMVTRAIAGPANKGRSHLIHVVCSPRAGLEDYILRFTSQREYEVKDSKGNRVGSGAYLKDFASADGLVSIPADAWLPYAWPEKGDVYTFRTIPEGHSAASESVRESAVLERGPLRSVIRLKGSLGPAGAPVLEYTAWYHFYAGSGRVKLAFTLENNNHGGRTPDGNARNANIGGINCVYLDEMALRLPLSFRGPSSVCVGGDAQSPAVTAPLDARAEIYQDSSGGEHWDRYRAPQFHPRPNSYVTFKGYRTFLGGVEAAVGRRAPGWLDVSDAAKGLTVGIEDFWQNYPKALAADKDGTVKIGLFPGRYAADFPLRSGEHKTHEVLFSFHAGAASDDGNKDIAPSGPDFKSVLRGFSDPLRLEASPQWLASTRALGDLHPLDVENYRAYEVRNLSALGEFPEGVPRGPSLLSRREENEFYGWMDYGDVPIDFEAPSGQWGMKYDLDYRMAQQYARTLDPRWWSLFVAADKHTRDIDIHHQPHYPGLHFVKGGVWAHSTHSEPGHKNPHRNYNHFTKDLSFGARGTATLYYLTGDWKSHDACLEIAENALAEYMSPQKDPGPPERNNRMGDRGEGCTLTRLLEGYLLSGDEKYLQRARWQVRSCAFDGKPAKHRPISLWASLFYMEALARYVETFPDDAAARSYLLAHLETLRKSADPARGILYTITPQPDGSVSGRGDCSHYNVLAADLLALANRLTGRADYLETARRCFACGVKNANGPGGSPTYFQVHSANGAMHGNVFMTREVTATAKAQTALANLAATMRPGQWAELKTENLVETHRAKGNSGAIFGYNEGAAWDPRSRQWLYVGGDHNAIDAARGAFCCRPFIGGVRDEDAGSGREVPRQRHDPHSEHDPAQARPGPEGGRLCRCGPQDRPRDESPLDRLSRRDPQAPPGRLGRSGEAVRPVPRLRRADLDFARRRSPVESAAIRERLFRGGTSQRRCRTSELPGVDEVRRGDREGAAEEASPELDLRGVTTVSDDAFTRAMIACRFLEAVGRADEKRPFPQRIHFTGWFDTGKRGREWPGDFEIVPHDKPLGWFAARAELLVDDLLLYEPGEAADRILLADAFGTAAGRAGTPSGTAMLATRRLHPVPGAAPGLLRFDLSSLPQSAKIVRADLVIARRGRLAGTEEDARINVEITADVGGPGTPAPLAVRGPWFDRLDATEAVRAWVSGRPNGGFLVTACPPWSAEASGLDVFYEGQPENVPPRVGQVRAVHRSGQTFLVFEEIDDRSADVAPAWGELKRRLAEMDRQRVVRYRVYRRAGPITAASLAQAEPLAEVQPMSGYNVLGRSVDQLIARHRRRAIDDLDFAKQLARNDYFEKYHPDMPEMGEVPIARFAVEDGRPLGPRMGLYVHHPDRPGKAYYAVVSVVDGAANTRDVSCVGPVDEIVGPGEPVLQGKPEVTVFFDYPGERRQYVQWAAPPLAHLPNQYYNWGLFVPRGYPRAHLKRLSIFFHDANQRYLKPPWPHRQDTLLLSPHDAPYRSFGYGYHESLGTLRSFRQGKVQPFFARRVDAMLDWALEKFAAQRACVSCGGAGPWGGTAAIQYGLRRPGKIAYVMADGPVDADPQQTPYQYSFYGRGDLRKTHRPDMDAVWGRPEWRVPSESGRPVWEELNLTAWVRTRGEATTLPFLSLGAGSQHLTWKQETDLMRACLQTHNAFMAEFFWGSSTHLHLPVGAEEGEHPFGPRADRPVLACDAKDRGPNPDFFKKHFETGQRGYAGGGRLNTQPRWDSQDVVDQPDRLEMTIYAAKHVVYAGQVTCDVAARNTRRFRPGPGEKLTWTVTDPRDRKKTQQGEATADAHGHVVIQGLTFGEPGRLVIRRAAEKGGKP